MLINILLYLPAILCFIWTLLLAFKKKTKTQRLLMELMILCFIYYTAYAIYISPMPDYNQLVLLDAISMPVIFAILALNIIYIYSHITVKKAYNWLHPILFLPSITYLSISVFLNFQMGFEQTALVHQAIDANNGVLPSLFDSPMDRLYYLVTIKYFRVLASAFLWGNLGTCFYVARKEGYRWGDATRFFLFGGTSTTPVRAICLMEYFVLLSMAPLTAAGRTFMHQHVALGVCLTLVITVALFFICYVEYFSELPHFSLKTLANVSFGESSKEDEPATTSIESIEPLNSDEAKAGQIVPSSLVSLIREAFEEKEVYRNPELTIKILADQLGTNRTTLSMAINQMFGVPFRQLLNNYRVNAAKNYMKEHPDATQEVIAAECGYLTAQAFNSKFKESTGISPRTWLSQN